MDTPTHKAPASFPILGNNYPKPSSPLIPRGSSHILKVSPLFTTMLDEGSSNMHNSHKRPHQYSLLPEDGPLDCKNIPMKKPKLLLTIFTCDQSSESETFAAKMEYQCLHAEELELITSLMKDEMEESQNSLHNVGIAVISDKGRKGAKKANQYSRVLPIHGHHEVDDSSVDDDKLEASEQS
ncbi:hypothetical protein BDR04DRAFT_1118753 [Suillus decipiens]|nr:hypothetical protein BDR04DRAFT_1118753 [Suillus decipiens]